MGVSVNKDGSYTGTWVPLKAGQYQLQLRLDGKETGTNKELSVTPPTLGKEEEEKKAESLAEEGQKTQFEMVMIKVCPVVVECVVAWNRSLYSRCNFLIQMKCIVEYLHSSFTMA